MGHNINYNKLTGKHSLMVTGRKAWHGLGQVVDTAQTSKEAIELAGLDFTVNKIQNTVRVPIQSIGDNGVEASSELITAPSYSTVRTDTNQPLGTVGDKYEVIQNVEGFDFIDSIIGNKLAVFETAGALNNGEVVFITCKLPSYIRLATDKNDVIEKYLLLKLSHDGSGAIKALFTPIRVVCNNTLNAALNSGAAFVSIMHTKRARDRMNAAKSLIHNANMVFDDAAAIYDKMANRRLSIQGAKRYINKLYLSINEFSMWDTMANDRQRMYNPSNVISISSRKRNMINEVNTYYLEGAGQQSESCKETVFGAYNAITGYYNNVSTFKSPDKRFTSIIEGNAANKSKYAFKLAMDIINN